MKTKIVEVTNAEGGGGINYGKFLVGRHDAAEWQRSPAVAGAMLPSLLASIGTNPDCVWVLDLQTREGASFKPGGVAKSDLAKHKIWVCPMFEPFLGWLYQQDLSDLDALPDLVKLTEAEAPSALAGYRREGRPASTPVERAETKAARRAMEVYVETLHQALAEAGESTVMEAIGTSRHEHLALVTGAAKGIIRATYVFDASPDAVKTVEEVERARGRGIGQTRGGSA